MTKVDVTDDMALSGMRITATYEGGRTGQINFEVSSNYGNDRSYFSLRPKPARDLCAALLAIINANEEKQP